MFVNNQDSSLVDSSVLVDFAGLCKRPALTLYKQSLPWHQKQFDNPILVVEFLCSKTLERQRRKGLTANTNAQMTPLQPQADNETCYPPQQGGLLEKATPHLVSVFFVVVFLNIFRFAEKNLQILLSTLEM